MNENLPSDAQLATSETLHGMTLGSYVYFLCINKECVYIGQTTRLQSRIAGHRRNPRMTFDSVFFIHVDPECRISTEHEWIASIKPRLNVRTTRRNDIARNGRRRFHLHMTEEQACGLKSIEQATGLSVAELVRRAIDDYLKKRK